MNKENKLQFEQLYLKDKLQKYPSFIGREYAIPPPKLKESGANDLTRLVVEWLQLNGCQAERISTTGLYRDNTKVITDVIGRQRTIGTGCWTPGQSTPGSADISSTIPININGNIIGVSVKWEIKWKKDVQSKAQKDYENNINKSGGYYFIVRTFDEFIEIYNSLLNSFLF